MPTQSPPLVSVIVPTRDRPEPLRRAIDSVLHQSYDKVEIIVVDDASRTPVTCHPSDDRVRVVRNETAGGPSAARNRGATVATGSVLAFLDDDDVWLPGKLDAVTSCFADHPEVGVVSHAVASADGAATASGAVQLDDRPVRRFLLSQPPHLSGVAVRRELHNRVRFDESFFAAEDLDYLIRLAAITCFAFLDDVLARHGQRAESPTLIAIERRIDARRQLRAKHDDLFDRRADAFHLMRLGHLYRRAGRRGSALVSFAHAAARCPTLGYAWRGMALVSLPARVRERRAR